ncbi:hypothetical protein BCR42DRAFT_403288 [Absidia repens]|uniref:Homeodomain-like protein n=1 Tax=Absidia repens TaxID=90262 RepID=A0A1X2IZ89_9FUNG|nr:hypothetical protein BCR42DRAFT_403288 [Absidia repens]
MFLLPLKRSWNIHGRSYTQISTVYSRSVGWEPWEDKAILDYVTVNGTKWSDLVQHCLPHKTRNACKVRWNTVLNPTLKRGPLTPMEGDLLRQGVTEIGFGKWTKIAEKYMPDRSPHQLSNAWTTSLDPTLVKRKPWTQEEDEKLLEGIKRFGFGQWTSIKRQWLPHRAHQTIRNRYVYHLDPTLQRDKEWTTDEVDILLRRTVLFGTDDWRKVAEGLAGRSPPQCRRKYTRHIDPARTRRGTAWSDKDQKLFWELVRIHQGRWKDISKYMARTEEECLFQFSLVLQRDLKVFYPADVIKQQKDETRPAWKRRIAEIMSNHLSQEQCAELESSKSLTSGTTTDQKHLTKDCENVGSDRGKQHKVGRRMILWTEEESSLLERLVEKYGNNWDLVAQHHGTKSARQCGNRYKNVIRYRNNDNSATTNNYIHNQPLTKNEKDLIVQGVDMFGHDWIAIANTYLPRRKPHQCMRWYMANVKHDNKQLDDDIHYDELDGTTTSTPTATALLERSSRHGAGRGRWTVEEDERLRFAMNEYSNNDNNRNTVDWIKVATLVNTGRTPLQCRQHWNYTLQPSIIKKGHWSWDEKLQLVELVQKNEMAADNNNNTTAAQIDDEFATKEGFWKTVAKTLNTGRSSWSCRLKYNYMVRTGTLFKS